MLGRITLSVLIIICSRRFLGRPPLEICVNFFDEQRAILMKSVLPVASPVSLTSDIWSGNAKEDYISIVAHYVSADWELQKKVIGFRLIEVSHSGENIAEKIFLRFSWGPTTFEILYVCIKSL